MSIDETEIRKEFKALFDNSLDLIYAHDLRGNFFDANNIALETLGYKRDDIPNLSFKNLIDKNQIVDALNIIKDLKENGKQSKRSEFKLKTKDGNSIYVESYGIPLTKNGEIYAILGIANDITERKNSEKKLIESESKFRSISEQSLMGIIILQDGVFKYVNETVAKIGGRPFQEIKDLSMQEFIRFIHPDDLSLIVEEAKKKQAGETDVATQYSCRIFSKSGKLKWVDVYSKSILYQGKPADFITLVDITDKKKAEQALKESEKRLKKFNKELEQIVEERTQDLKQSEEKHRRLINNISDVIIESDNSGNFIYISPQVTDLFGFEPEEVIGKNALQFIHPEDLQNARNKMEKAFDSENEVSIEFRALHKKGYYIPVSAKGSLFNENGKTILIGVIRDITERKKMEEELRESEEMFRAVFETAKDCIFIKNRSLQYIQVNPAMEEMFGFPAEDLINKTDIDIFGEKAGTHVMDVDLRVIQGENIEEESIKPVHGVPHSFYTVKVPLKDSEGNIFGLCGIARDISERKKAEQKLKESEEKFKMLYKGIPIPTYTWQKENDDLILIDYNIASEKITDGKIQNYLGIKASELYKDQPVILEELYRCIKYRVNISREIFYYYQSINKKKYLLTNYGFVPPDLVLVHTEDITDKKIAEEKLRKSERKYRNIIDNSKDAIVIVGFDGKYKFISPQLSKMMGREINLKSNLFDKIHPNDLKDLIKFFSEAIRQKQVLEKREVEFRTLHKDGHYIWLSSSSKNYYDKNGNVVGFITLLRDITDKKIAEQRLKESEEKYRHLFENSPFSILLVDTKGNIIESNSTIEKLYGIKKEEILNKNYKEILLLFKVSELQDLFEDRIKKVLGGIITPSIEIPSYIEDGSLVWINLHSSLVKLGEKKLIQVILQDITERKVAEKALKKLNRELENKVIERTKELEKSEKKFRQIFESIPDLFLLVDENTTVIDYRGKKEEFFIPPEQFLSEKLSDILPFKLGKMAKEYVSKTISSKQPQILEYSLPMKGKDHYYEARLLFFTENRVAIFIRDITERKWTEEALREEKNRAQKYLDIAAVALVIINAKKEVTLINQKGCEILGYEQKEIVGKNWFDNFIPERNRNEVKSVFQKLIAGKVEPVEYFENPILTNNNEERIIAWHNTILNDEKGNIIGTLSSGEDITERMQVEEALRESEKKYRGILESISEVYYELDLKGNFIFFNDRACEFLGYLRDELIGMNYREYMDKKNQEIAFKLYNTMYEKDIPQTVFEYEMIRSNGNKIFVESSVYLKHNSEGEKIGFYGLTRDITERKQIERELIKTKDEQALILKSVSELISYQDKELKIIWANKAAAESVGLTTQQLIGHHCYEIWQERDSPCIGCPVLKAIETGQLQKADIATPDGRYLFIRGTPVKGADGNILGAVETTLEITERKKAEQQLKESEKKLREQNIELRKLDELKNDFITIAAHELKTPMVSITGYTDYILTHYKDLDFEIRKDLLLIQKNSQRLNLLIEKLLDVMKIDAKKMEIIREEKNIYDIIENCVEELSFQINNKKLNIIIDVQKDLYMKVDPNRIYEVFSNLFSNAVKFTLDGGNIEISAKKIKNQFLFKVRNDGKGLNIHDIRKLFKKFEVIEKESADHINRKKGLGLGLYISKGVVEAHGGKIWGTSKGKDKGAEFYFTLPIIEA